MKKLASRALILWLPLVVVLTGVSAFIYIAVQQNYRQSVNDPQIQIAEDAALSLSKGGTPADLVPHGAPLVDIRTSLATWTTVYDSSGIPLESSAILDGAPPLMPEGLLDTNTWTAGKTWDTPRGRETRVTWQPRPDVRQAVVLIQFDKGYVAVGRSMRTTEERIINLTWEATVAWSMTALASFAAVFILLALC